MSYGIMRPLDGQEKDKVLKENTESALKTLGKYLEESDDWVSEPIIS